MSDSVTSVSSKWRYTTAIPTSVSLDTKCNCFSMWMASDWARFYPHIPNRWWHTDMPYSSVSLNQSGQPGEMDGLVHSSDLIVLLTLIPLKAHLSSLTWDTSWELLWGKSTHSACREVSLCFHFSCMQKNVVTERALLQSAHNEFPV